MSTESEDQVFNPAARLCNLLRAARAQPQARQGEVEPLAIVVWSRVLACSPEDEDLFIRRFISLRSLKMDAERAINALAGINHALYLRWATPVRDLLSISTLYRHWDQVSGSLTEVVLQGLEYAAEQLSRHHLQAAVPTDHLDLLRDEVTTLLNDVEQDTSLPSALRDRVTTHLRAILVALRDYDIRGIEVIELVLDSSVGDVFIRRQEYLENKDHEVI